MRTTSSSSSPLARFCVGESKENRLFFVPPCSFSPSNPSPPPALPVPPSAEPPNTVSNTVIVTLQEDLDWAYFGISDTIYLNLDSIQKGREEKVYGDHLRHALLQTLYNRVDEEKHAVMFGMIKDLQIGRSQTGGVRGMYIGEEIKGGGNGAEKGTWWGEGAGPLYFSKIGYCPPENKPIKPVAGSARGSGGAGGQVAGVVSGMRMAPEVVRRLGKKKVVVNVYLEMDDFDWGWLVGMGGEGEGPPMVTVTLLHGHTCVHLRHEIWQELYDRCPKGFFFFFFQFLIFIVQLSYFS